MDDDDDDDDNDDEEEEEDDDDDGDGLTPEGNCGGWPGRNHSQMCWPAEKGAGYQLGIPGIAMVCSCLFHSNRSWIKIEIFLERDPRSLMINFLRAFKSIRHTSSTVWRTFPEI